MPTWKPLLKTQIGGYGYGGFGALFNFVRHFFNHVLLYEHYAYNMQLLPHNRVKTNDWSLKFEESPSYRKKVISSSSSS